MIHTISPAQILRFLEREVAPFEIATFENTICPCDLPSCVERRARSLTTDPESRTPTFDEQEVARLSAARAQPQTREARIEEIERRRDSVLAEHNPNLPTYEAK